MIACIERDGLAAATSQAIADEVGLSVGAVQHHFRSKEDMLAAVLEESARRFGRCFADGAPVASDITERTGDFVERAWRHYGSAFFRVAHEIMLAVRPRAHSASAAMRAAARVAEDVWLERFGDLPLTPATQRDLRRHAFASLTGLALVARFEPEASRLRRPLAHLKTGLAANLQAAVDARMH